MTISSPRIRYARIHARFIFISKINEKAHVYDIGILDDDYNYYEHHLTSKIEALTFFSYKAFNKIFGKYSITKETEIDILNTIDRKEPLFMYLDILNQQVFANLKVVDLDMIPRRIAAYHNSYIKNKKSSDINKYYIERLWNKLVELEKCPWITQELNVSL